MVAALPFLHRPQGRTPVAPRQCRDAVLACIRGQGNDGAGEPVTRFFRYAAVGAVATAVHYAILAGCVEAALLPPSWAAALGAWVGAQVAFAGNAWFTFAGAPVTVVAWLRFQIVAVLGALISFSVVGAGVGAGLHYLVAQAIATLVSLFVTYEVNRRWSFAATPGRR
jgi:putative flippase GtrA